MGDIADDCFDLAMDELDRNYTNPDWLEEQQHILNRRLRLESEIQKCKHNFSMGNCPNHGCSGHAEIWIPF